VIEEIATTVRIAAASAVTTAHTPPTAESDVAPQRSSDRYDTSRRGSRHQEIDAHDHDERENYWRGRAAEAAGQLDEMRAQYQAAASYPVAYYGQLARARLGLDDVVELRSPPEPADAKTSEALRAASILYRIGEGDLAMAFVTDLAEESSDPVVIAGLGKLTALITMPRRCCSSARRRSRAACR
jgi:hypothetical protein